LLRWLLINVGKQSIESYLAVLAMGYLAFSRGTNAGYLFNVFLFVYLIAGLSLKRCHLLSIFLFHDVCVPFHCVADIVLVADGNVR
jgi:hypothetical protein